MPAAADRNMTQPSNHRGFSRLQLVSRSQQVRDQLEQAIRSGDYAVGDRLPSERELAQMFGVSRVSVREALRSLEAVGLVEVKHGAGTMVVDPAQRATRDLSRWMKANRGEVLELLHVRSALDELAGEEAANRRDPEEIAAVRRAHEAFAEAAEEGRADRLADLDTEFHLAIAAASGSELLRNLLAELHHHLAESRAVFFAPVNRGKASAREHGTIVAAIERGDGPAARKATRDHIASVRKVMESA
ncbi:MAG: FadR family transcriptional regulator [Thermoleophilaceae bacterium]|nr:FadR family transcriptional regulator [Thermoleophilaceae bacterium]